MEKEEYIKRYGKAAYEKMQQQCQEWKRDHPEKVKASGKEQCRKGGKHYKQFIKHRSIGIPHERGLVRMKHGHLYRPYKKIIAPDSVLHHQWQVGTANYDGVALVEKQQHQHGYIDVVQILEGEITLFTEAEVRKGGCEI